VRIASLYNFAFGRLQTKGVEAMGKHRYDEMIAAYREEAIALYEAADRAGKPGFYQKPQRVPTLAEFVDSDEGRQAMRLLAAAYVPFRVATKWRVAGGNRKMMATLYFEGWGLAVATFGEKGEVTYSTIDVAGALDFIREAEPQTLQFEPDSEGQSIVSRLRDSLDWFAYCAWPAPEAS